MGAVVFLHGFTGSRDDTWDRFPGLLGTYVADWDIFTLGYATTFLPDLTGVWSADPDLPILATLYRTELAIRPLDRYDCFTLVAHSMGGLVIQRALVDDPSLCTRVRHLILFGTPSRGLRKASWLQFWKRQLRNMAEGSDFIRDLRERWVDRFEPKAGFQLTIVAAERDQFVPPRSSLEPFERSLHRVVPGDHLSMVKPAGANSESLRLLISTLSNVEPAREKTRDPLRLAAEEPQEDVSRLIDARTDAMSQEDVVRAALALERGGMRDQSIRLLELHQSLGTDVQGALAGRIKRLWLESESEAHAQRALFLYEQALERALASNDHEQIYYHAINVAFLSFVALDRTDRARDMAKLALSSCAQSPDTVWNMATQAEANLYLGERDLAITFYRQVLGYSAERWQLASASLQASRVAGQLGDQGLAEALEEIFTPGARRVNKIFLSYSHKDSDWADRFVTIMKPYLREAEEELELWVDREGIEPGDDWFEKISDALRTAGVGLVLVTADFLASDFVMTHELPAIIDLAKDGNMRLFWVYVSPAAYDATPLRHFQAAHDLGRPLSSMEDHEQDQTLLDIARKVKEAALAATERFIHANLAESRRTA